MKAFKIVWLNLCVLASIILCQLYRPESKNTPNFVSKTDVVLPTSLSEINREIAVVSTKGWDIFELNLAMPLSGFSFDKSGNLWIGYKGGVAMFNMRRNDFREFEFENRAFEWSNVVDGGYGEIWTAGYVYRKNEWIEQEIGYPIITDKNGGIWGSSHQIGEPDCVRYFYLNTWEDMCPPLLGEAILISLAVSPDNSIWASYTDIYKSKSLGVWELNNKVWKKINELESHWPIYTLLRSENGYIWAIGSKNLNSNEDGWIKIFDGVTWHAYESDQILLDNYGGKVIYRNENVLMLSPGYLVEFRNGNVKKISINQFLETVIEEPVNVKFLGINQDGLLCLATDKKIFCESVPNSLDGIP